MTKTNVRRGWIIGIVAVAAIGLLAGVARETQAFGGHGHRGGAIMRRIATAHIDEALDAAKVTKEQREKVHAIKERLFRTFEDSHRGRGAHLEEALRVFSADRLDRDRIAAMRKERQAEMERMGDAVEQAITEVHALLTPAQRKAVADYIAQHRPGR
jgi:Spy/CpxP family protein refolding chaperone